MTLSFNWTGPPRVPRSASVLVYEALLPMLMWTSVPVLRRIDQDLTVVDRFIVEAALGLAPMRAEDVEEITTIPRDAVLRVIGRLIGLGLLTAEGADYYAVEENASKALEERAVPRYDTAFVTLFYLPEGDDLIAFSSGGGRTAAPMLHRAEPVAVRLTPRRISERPLHDLLRDRIENGRVAGLPDDIVDAAESELTVPAACQVYRCRGHVRSADDTVTLVLSTVSPSGKRHDCVIPGAVGQAGRWAGLATRAPEAAEAWGSGGSVVAVSEIATRWAFALDGPAAADAVRAGVTVSRPAGLSIATEADSAVAVAVGVSFAPSDEEARGVFALDQAVHEVTDVEPAKIGPDTMAVACSRARQNYELADDELTDVDVQARLWDDGHFRHIYAMRAPVDFAYD